MSVPAFRVDRYQRRCGTILLVLLGLILVVLGARVVHINISLGERLLAIAERQHQGKSVIPARRGNVYDARGRLAATSRQSPDVFVDPTRVEDLTNFANELSSRLSVAPQEIIEKVRARPDSRYVVVAAQVDEVTAEAVRSIKHAAVGLTDRFIRNYPLGTSMAHVLGAVGRDHQGLEGIELKYDGHLKGRDGRRLTVRDARRRALWRDGNRPEPPSDGGHVVLTLDAEIQRITENAVNSAVTRFEAESAVAIVLSPKNGDVLAMALSPSFDANQASEVTSELRRNRAITDPTEPGSTFKPIIMAGALEGGFVNDTEQINCHNGEHQFGGRVLTDTKPHSFLDVRGIITYSSNIGMATLAERMGNKALYETIHRFGFGRPTGVELPGEAEGLLYPLRKWNSYSTTSVCIGYEIGVTPLQLANAFAAMVNDGVLLKPRVVKQLLTADGEALETFEEGVVVGRAAEAEVARFVSEDLMVSVVEHGGGSNAGVGPYRVLGKTGTAKLPYRDRRGYEPGAYMSAFVGAAPVRDPEVVVLVMVRRPTSRLGYYGREVAAPAAGKIMAEVLAYMGVPPDEPTDQLAGL